MNRSVLIIDNLSAFLDTCIEWLETSGYTAFGAGSIEEAEEFLERSWVDVCIVDVRMRDDNDDKDTSGITFAKDPRYRSIPKIILTRYPTYEQAREALGPVMKGLPPAVDFVAKQEGMGALVRAVEKAFESYVRLDALDIEWGRLHSFHLASLIAPETERSLLAGRSDELEDLFRKLFRTSAEVTLGRILTQTPGLVFVEVFAHRERGGEEFFVVACGERALAIAEAAGFSTFAPAGSSGTSLVTQAETTHFAATLYRLTNAEHADILLLGEFYTSRPAEVVGAALEHLFHTTLGTWHRQGRVHQSNQPGGFPGDWLGPNGPELDSASVEERARAIARSAVSADIGFLEQATHRLTVQLPGETPRTYPNPASVLGEAAQLGALPTLSGHTHGRVVGDTVLVDRSGHTWVIDFSQAAAAPLLRDYVSLESAITLDLLDTSDLHGCFMLEQCLLAPDHLGESLAVDALPTNLQHTALVIERLRGLAAELPGADLTTYRAGLLAFALRRVAAYDPNRRYPRRELLPYAHALLAAAMLTEKFLVPTHQFGQLPAEAQTGFWLDRTNKVAWVEGRRVVLTRQEFQILDFLDEHAGELCSHEQIVTGALRDEVEDAVLEAGRLTSAMTRLRKKIESPGTKQPKYIKTVHGHGYLLDRGSS